MLRSISAATARRFGQWVGVELSGSNHKQMWIPPGLAHGFMVTSDSADFLYKTTDYYAPELEGAVRWDDPQLAIAWPLDALGGEPPSLSGKDADRAVIDRPALMGWHGRLALDYDFDGETTRSRSRHHGPMRVLASLYPEGPRVCHHILVHPPGGWSAAMYSNCQCDSPRAAMWY